MKGRNQPRLKDVAAAANVSMCSASHILRGNTDRFSEETCRRVTEAAKQLGWRRNLLVSGMQTGRTQTIGVMIPPYDSFWLNVLIGLHQRLAQVDYLPITIWQGDIDHMPHFEADEYEGIKQIDRLLDRRVDGLVMWPSFGTAYKDHLAELTEKNVPVVVIDYRDEQPIGDSVGTNETAATRSVAKYLVDLGHKRIACISSRESKSQTWAQERRKKFEQAVSLSPEVEIRSWRLNRAGSDGVAVATELLSGEFKPTAVFAVTDHEAECVYEAAITLGLSIPEDVSVVGFSDLDFAAKMTPALTTVRQRPRDIGEKAANLILGRLNGDLKDEPHQNELVETDLIVRDSSGPASVGR